MSSINDKTRDNVVLQPYGGGEGDSSEYKSVTRECFSRMPYYDVYIKLEATAERPLFGTLLHRIHCVSLHNNRQLLASNFIFWDHI